MPNKNTAEVKAVIKAVFEGIGGEGNMITWAKANPGDFYTKVYPKLLPLDVSVEVNEDLANLLAEARRRAV